MVWFTELKVWLYYILLLVTGILYLAVLNKGKSSDSDCFFFLICMYFLIKFPVYLTL